MKTTLKITAKGQITLRKSLLDQMGLRPGDQVTVEVAAPGRLEMRPAARKGRIDDFVGSASRPDGPVLSLEQIEQIIQVGWVGRK